MKRLDGEHEEFFPVLKLHAKNILKYYVMYSEVREQCLCLAVAVLEAPSPAESARHPRLPSQVICHFLK